MPRRALPKLSPAIDLDRHLIEIERLARPWSSQDLFGREAPLELEIGSGKGLFLVTAADRQPQTDFLGCEVAMGYARFAAARLATSQITNARVIHGDASRLLAEFFSDACVAAVHVYFPDPWWKRRHRKRRLMNDQFVAEIVRVLAPQGRLHFWSDVAEYFATTLRVIARQPRLEGPEAEPELTPEHEFDYRTHFERRMRLHGRPVYRARFVKAR